MNTARRARGTEQRRPARNEFTGARARPVTEKSEAGELAGRLVRRPLAKACRKDKVPQDHRVALRW
jgi:hypothetical protein